MYKVHVIVVFFLGGGFSETSFSTDFRKKSSNIKFHENPSSGSRAVPCGQTDRHDEANGRFKKILRTHLKIVVSSKNATTATDNAATFKAVLCNPKKNSTFSILQN